MLYFYAISLCYISMLYFYAIFLCYISMLYFYAIFLCYISMLYFYAIFLCYISMLYFYAIFLCYISMLYFYAIFLCYISMLYFYAIFLCYISMLYFYAIFLCYIFILYFYAFIIDSFRFASDFTVARWWRGWLVRRCLATVCSGTPSTPPAGWRAMALPEGCISVPPHTGVVNTIAMAVNNHTTINTHLKPVTVLRNIPSFCPAILHRFMD